MKYFKNTLYFSVFLITGPLWASGFGLYEQGVQGQGNAGAFVARAEDASAVYINPAGLANLHYGELAISGKSVGSRSFYSNAGQSTWRSDLPYEVLPALFANSKLSDKIGVGVGSTTTFQYELDWEEQDYPGRYLFNQSSFEVREHMAGIGYKVTDAFSIGATIRFAQLDFKLGSVLPRPLDASNPSLYYETQELYELDGEDTGFALGFQYYKSRRFSMGLSYHSPIEISLDGSRSYSLYSRQDDVRAQNAFANTFTNGSASSVFELPERIQIGYNSRITVRTRLEVDAVFEGWSSVDAYQFQNQSPAGGSSSATVPRGWDDTYSFRIAGDFQQRKALLWRIGLASYQSPVPDETLAPDFPDYDRFAYSFGASYTFRKKYTIEAAWQLIQNRDRASENKELSFDPNSESYTVANGQDGLFESQRIQIQLGLRVRLGQ